MAVTKKRLVEWDGCAIDITLGKVYEVSSEGYFVDDSGDKRVNRKGVWELPEAAELGADPAYFIEPVKSDGLSSSYYELTINDNHVETEDIIRDVFGNDFDFGNAFKCLVRMYACKQGRGKAGNDLAYDANKIRYSINKIEGVSNHEDT